MKAEHDLRNAEHTLTLEEDCPFDTVAFHAQQCVEKSLKALLVRAGGVYRRGTVSPSPTGGGLGWGRWG